MHTRYLRLLLAALVLFALFFIDAWINIKTNFGLGVLASIGFAVAFHVLVFEAVFTKSKPLTFTAWAVVAISSGLSFFFLDSPLDSFIVVIFLVAYTALLMLYLEKIARQ